MFKTLKFGCSFIHSSIGNLLKSAESPILAVLLVATGLLLLTVVIALCVGAFIGLPSLVLWALWNLIIAPAIPGAIHLSYWTIFGLYWAASIVFGLFRR